MKRRGEQSEIENEMGKSLLEQKRELKKSFLPRIENNSVKQIVFEGYMENSRKEKFNRKDHESRYLKWKSIYVKSEQVLNSNVRYKLRGQLKPIQDIKIVHYRNIQ